MALVTSEFQPLWLEFSHIMKLALKLHKQYIQIFNLPSWLFCKFHYYFQAFRYPEIYLVVHEGWEPKQRGLHRDTCRGRWGRVGLCAQLCSSHHHLGTEHSLKTSAVSLLKVCVSRHLPEVPTPEDGRMMRPAAEDTPCKGRVPSSFLHPISLMF